MVNSTTITTTRTPDPQNIKECSSSRMIVPNSDLQEGDLEMWCPDAEEDMRYSRRMLNFCHPNGSFSTQRNLKKDAGDSFSICYAREGFSSPILVG
jgi:hypothetical protein